MVRDDLYPGFLVVVLVVVCIDGSDLFHFLLVVSFSLTDGHCNALQRRDNQTIEPQKKHMRTFPATKLGRTPLWVDLDPSENALSVPGTLAVAPMSRSAVSIETYASSGLPPSTSAPLVLWYGSTTLDNVNLFKAQVSAMATKINQRLRGGDVDGRASGLIVNTNGNIQDVSLALAGFFLSSRSRCSCISYK